jgi:DNA-binding NarL/FixJ family response regulator
MKRVLQILLVDDHTLVRESLAERLRSEADLDVVDTASNAEDAVKKVRERKPDVVVMDINMPGMVCFDAATRISRMAPETRIVFLSAYSNDQFIDQAIRVKAAGYLTKLESPEMIIEALRRIADGETFYSSEIAARIESGSRAKRTIDVRTPLAQLTRREHEVLRYIALGLARRDIAETMHISTKTVAAHTSSLMRKLGLHDRVALTRFAIREGIIEA